MRARLWNNKIKWSFQHWTRKSHDWLTSERTNTHIELHSSVMVWMWRVIVHIIIIIDHMHSLCAHYHLCFCSCHCTNLAWHRHMSMIPFLKWTAIIKQPPKKCIKFFFIEIYHSYSHENKSMKYRTYLLLNWFNCCGLIWIYCFFVWFFTYGHCDKKSFLWVSPSKSVAPPPFSFRNFFYLYLDS